MFDGSKEQKLYMTFWTSEFACFEKSTEAQYYFKKTLFVCHVAVPSDGL